MDLVETEKLIKKKNKFRDNKKELFVKHKFLSIKQKGLMLFLFYFSCVSDKQKENQIFFLLLCFF